MGVALADWGVRTTVPEGVMVPFTRPWAELIDRCKWSEKEERGDGGQFYAIK